jgi:subtilisin family serine protease
MSSRSTGADAWIAELKSTVHTYIDRPSKYPRRIPAVKIAALDTGIDLKHPFINGALKSKRIQVARSFVNNDDSPEDSFGHGTHVTKLILDVAPDAELYIAKVAKEGNIPPDHNIAKVSLAELQKEAFAWRETY